MISGVNELQTVEVTTKKNWLVFENSYEHMSSHYI